MSLESPRGTWPEEGSKEAGNAQRILSRFEVPDEKLENRSEDGRKFMEQILLLYSQKDVSRWGGENLYDDEREDMRESLATHVGGMNMIARLVKERARQDNDKSILSLDWDKIDRLIQVHDLAESIFGDKVNKTAFDEKDEDDAMQMMIDKGIELGMGDWVAGALAEYWERDDEGRKGSRETNFVKTLDEIDGLMQMFHARRLDKNKRGYDAHIEFFEKYARDFPSLRESTLYMVETWNAMKDDPEWAYDTFRQTDMLPELDVSLEENKTNTES